MQTLDNLSKRILVIAVSISLVLLSASAFVLSIQRAQAAQPAPTPSFVNPTRAGVSVVNGYAYYLTWVPGNTIYESGKYVIAKEPLPK